MPERETIERAERAKQQGKRPTTQQGSPRRSGARHPPEGQGKREDSQRRPQRGPGGPARPHAFADPLTCGVPRAPA
jgi:hypothetical protein